MELICPACEARYQVPDGSIGEKGRQVSCMNCGHGWHAYPPLVLGAPGETPRTNPGWQASHAPGPGAGAAPLAAVGPAEPTPRLHTDTSSSWAPPVQAAGTHDHAAPETTSRSEQLAEIREMLAEVQNEQPSSGIRATSDPIDDTSNFDFDDDEDFSTRRQTQALFDDPESPAAQAPHPEPEPLPRHEEEYETATDPLRQRMGAQAEKAVQAKPTDVRRLRRRHEKRERKRKHAKAAGSGAFLTGFLLVAMIAAVIISVYMLSPQIIERLPGTEKAMTQYVDTIDGLRVSVAEIFDDVKGWVSEQTDKG